MSFDENKVMWTSQECLVGAAGDRIYERAAKYLDEEDPNKVRILGLAVHMVADDQSRADFVLVIGYLFGGSNYRHFLNRVTNIAIILKRDNGWLDV